MAKAKARPDSIKSVHQSVYLWEQERQWLLARFGSITGGVRALIGQARAAEPQPTEIAPSHDGRKTVDGNETAVAPVDGLEVAAQEPVDGTPVVTVTETAPDIAREPAVPVETPKPEPPPIPATTPPKPAPSYRIVSTSRVPAAYKGFTGNIIASRVLKELERQRAAGETVAIPGIEILS